MLGNSAFIAAVTVVLTLLVSSMAAFVLAHLRFAGKKWLANYLALGLMFPFANSRPAGLYSGARHGTSGFALGSHFAADSFQSGLRHRVATGLFAELPHELFEAAFVDGCSYPRMFWQITLPLSRSTVPSRKLERIFAAPSDDQQ
jgi:raffinose/stachyose/melibiose transport system permease protein